MKSEKFDGLLSEIRNESVDEKVVAQASDRVWKSIAEAAPATHASPHILRSCDDFQSLIPAYVAKQLAPARALLFEDHVHACVACRSRSGNSSRSARVRLAGVGRWLRLRSLR